MQHPLSALGVASAGPIVVLADDLTGAADCAARATAAGVLSTIYVQAPSVLPGPPRLPGLLAVSTDSRHLPPDRAADRVIEHVALLAGLRQAIWYKKIDSTLRGNLGSEVEALLAALGRRHAIIAPAFPAQRRGLVHGQVVLDAVPQPGPNLATLLRDQTQLPITHIPLCAVRDGMASVAHLMIVLAQSGTRLFALDAMSDADLDTIAAAGRAALPEAVFCGSAGLLSALTRSRDSSPPDQGLVSLDGDGMVVGMIGSGSIVAQKQIEHLRRVNGVAVCEWPGPVEAAAGHDLLIHLPPPALGATLEGPEARAKAQQLAQVALAIRQRHRPASWILSGGDTAAAVLSAFGVDTLVVACELLPGMPLASGIAGDGGRVDVVLKSGNHGDPATLHTLLHRLHHHYRAQR